MSSADRAISAATRGFCDRLAESGVVKSWADNVTQEFFEFEESLLRENIWKHIKELLLPLINYLRTARDKENAYEVHFWLVILSTSQYKDDLVLKLLRLAFRQASGVEAVNDLRAHQYILADGLDLTRPQVQDIVVRAYRHPRQSFSVYQAQYQTYQQPTMSAVASFPLVQRFIDAISQFPRRITPNREFEREIDTDKALTDIELLRASCKNNYQLAKYLETLIETVDPLDNAAPIRVPDTLHSHDTHMSGTQPISQASNYREIFRGPAPQLALNGEIDKMEKDIRASVEVEQHNIDRQQLDILLSRLDQSATHDLMLGEYVQTLRESALALSDYRKPLPAKTMNIDHEALTTFTQTCEKNVRDLFSNIKAFILNLNSQELIMSSNLIPATTPNILLSQLRAENWVTLEEEWKHVILDFALACAQRGRAARLSALAQKNDQDGFFHELINKPYTNWSPRDCPEALLIELQCGITIRAEQWEVVETLSRSGSNTVTQLNMGAGKSSTILPVMAVKASRPDRLVCIVVPKQLVEQTHRMLNSALSGFLGRKVFRLSFTRAEARTADRCANVLSELHEYMKSRDVIIMEPEHVLSLQLLVCEKHIDGPLQVAKAHEALQSFIDEHMILLIDESDEVLSPRREVVYTMGRSQPLQQGRVRWTAIRTILCVLPAAAAAAQRSLPDMITVSSRPGRYPDIQVLDPAVADTLIKAIAQQIFDSNEFSWINHLDVQDRAHLFQWITSKTLDQRSAEAIDEALEGKFTESSEGCMAVLRGFLAGGALVSILMTQRWRVSYGSTNTRNPQTSLAVPYTGKDQPSERSDYSNPDIQITLTCLSHYNAGLSDHDIHITIEALKERPEAQAIYREWLKDTVDMPQGFRTLVAVTAASPEVRRSAIFPHLRFIPSVINWFLGNIVFPRDIRAYRQKLSVSAWELGKQKAFPTVGFSGTRDNNALFPLSVMHTPISALAHTDALVLCHVLENSNGITSLPMQSNDANSQCLLALINQLDPSVQVLLDVGALFLDMSNVQVAQTWLQSRQDKQVAVYVDTDDRLCVADRSGTTEELQHSSYAQNPDSWLVYLDEAHCRGTDLKLPRSYRAAVTVGRNLTKDKLVQACMRMRQLAYGQSLVFCVPEDVCRQIKLGSNAPFELSVASLAEWTIKNTISQMKAGVPQWSVQGKRFLENRYHEQITSALEPDSWYHHLLEDEEQSIEDLYGSGLAPRSDFFARSYAADYAEAVTIQKRLDRYAVRWAETNLFREREQERQREQEHQRQRQVDEPRRARMPRIHTVEDSLVKLWTTGKFAAAKSDLHLAFARLGPLAQRFHYDTRQLYEYEDHRLYVSKDFAASTDKQPRANDQSWLQRNAFWVVMLLGAESNVVTKAILVTDYEASKLQESQQQSGVTVRMALYSPCRRMEGPRFDKLDFCVFPQGASPHIMPKRLRIQLNLFAGSLWFRNMTDYEDTALFLSLLSSTPPTAFQQVSVDGHYYLDQVDPGDRFSHRDSPVPFMRYFMSKIRHNGADIGATHVGKMLSGTILKPDDFI